MFKWEWPVNTIEINHTLNLEPHIVFGLYDPWCHHLWCGLFYAPMEGMGCVMSTEAHPAGSFLFLRLCNYFTKKDWSIFYSAVFQTVSKAHLSQEAFASEPLMKISMLWFVIFFLLHCSSLMNIFSCILIGLITIGIALSKLNLVSICCCSKICRSWYPTYLTTYTQNSAFGPL